jgi:hypothetical protein
MAETITTDDLKNLIYHIRSSSGRYGCGGSRGPGAGLMVPESCFNHSYIVLH